MQKEVMVALISLAGTIAGSFGGVLASSKLTAYRLRLLENKVDKHNRFAERLPVVEEKIKVLNQSGGGPGARRGGSIYAFKVKQGVYRTGEDDRFV